MVARHLQWLLDNCTVVARQPQLAKRKLVPAEVELLVCFEWLPWLPTGGHGHVDVL